MKKTIFSAFIVMTVAAALWGCGREKGSEALLDTKNPAIVKIWHYYNGVQQITFDEMVRDFNDTVGFEKGIIVEAYSKSSIDELSQSVMASVKGEPGADTKPDILAAYAETAYELDKMEALTDIKQYLSEEEQAEYVDEYLQEGMFSGDSVKILPTAKSTEVMMLNKTDWEKFSSSTGTPLDELATVEGVTEAAEKYYEYTDALTPDIENDGRAFFGRDSVANYMYIGAKQLGNEYVTVDGDGIPSPDIDKAVMRRLWDNYYVPFVKGHFTAQSRFRSDDAKSGALIALVCSTTGAAYFPDEVTIGDEAAYPIENVIVPVPHFEGAEDYLVQQGAGMCVLKSDKKTEYASMVFLKWFTEQERNIKFAIGSGYLPVKEEANDYDKMMEVNDMLKEPVSPVMRDTFDVAIREVKSRKLYASRPFEHCTEMRSFIEAAMEDAASDAYARVSERVAAGEDREAVLEKYIGDAAFESWYDSFVSGLEQIISK